MKPAGMFTKKQDSEVFLHYVEDVPHRFEAWVISSSSSDKMGMIVNDEKGECVDDLSNQWEVIIDDIWQTDNTANITCDDSYCCEMFSIASSGPIGDKFPEAMDSYTKRDENINGKPSYSSAGHFLFYHLDMAHHFKGWTISTTLQELGSIVKEGDVACAEAQDGTWEFLDEEVNQWVKDDEMTLRCVESCCMKVTVSSSGAAAENFPELMDIYKITSEENGKAAYEGINSGASLHYIDDVPHRWSGWVMGEGMGKISNDEQSDCPSDMAQFWDVFVDNTWVKDESLSVVCN